MKLFSRPVRTILACACACSSVSPAFAAVFKDQGVNVNANNSVKSTENASVIDYHTNVGESLVAGLTEIFTGSDYGLKDLANISGIAVSGVGVIHWNSFNVDSGKTLVVGSKTAASATLYNIVDGGGMTTIAGNLTSFNNLNGVLKTALEQRAIFGTYFGSGTINTWIINPAGISVSSGASINLNGYLGLVAGSVSGVGSGSTPTFSTVGVGSKPCVNIDQGATLNLGGPMYLFANKVDVSASVNVPAYVANGQSIALSGTGISNTSDGTIDAMTLSITGSFRDNLTLIAASDLRLGDISVYGESKIESLAGDITLAGSVNFYGVNNMVANRGSITLSTDTSASSGASASVSSEALFTATARDDIRLDGSGNLFLNGVTLTSSKGSVALGAKRGSDHTLSDSPLSIVAAGDISLAQYGGDLALGSGHTLSTGDDGKLTLSTPDGSITLNQVNGWNGNLGSATAKGSVRIEIGMPLNLLGSVEGADVMLKASEIAATAKDGGAITATSGDISLQAANGIDVAGTWKIAAEKGLASFVNTDSGDLVIGRPTSEANGAKVEIVARNVLLEQKSAGDLVVEENATVTAKGTETTDTGITIRHQGDLYVFGGVSQDLPDYAQGFDEEGKPKAYKLPTIESTGEGVVRAMSLDMRQRDYKLSDLKGEFGTWDHLEYMRLYNLGENLTVDKNLTLETAASGTRTGNRSQYVFEGAGDLTVTLPDSKLALDASATGLRLVAGEGKTLTLAGAGAIVTGDKALVIDAGELTSDGAVTVKAGVLEFRSGVDVALLDNAHVYADAIRGEAGDIALQANAYLDADAFRLAGDLKAGAVRIDAGDRDFIGGTETGVPTDSSNLYDLNATSLALALRQDAKLYLKASAATTVRGLARGSDEEAFTTVADFRFDAAKGITLAGNRTSKNGTLSVTDLGTEKMSGDVYLRETRGSMDVKSAIRTTGNATFIAPNDGATLAFADGNDVGGSVSIAANSAADVAFANEGSLSVSRISGNDVTLKSANGDVSVAAEGAYVQGTISLDAAKGNATVGRQTVTDANGEETGRWSGRLGTATAQGTVTAETSGKLVLEGDINAGAAVLIGDEDVIGNNRTITLTAQNKVPNDEYSRNTTGQLTAKSSSGAVKLGEEGEKKHSVVAFAAEAQDGVTFANDRQLTVKNVTVANGDATLASASEITLAGTAKARNVTLRGGQKVDFGEHAVIDAEVGTTFVADNADFTLDLDAVESRTVRAGWNLGKISATAGQPGLRHNVTIVGQSGKDLEIGTINGQDVKLVGKAGVNGDRNSSVNADGTLAATAEAGDVALVGANTVKGAATLAANSYTVENEETGETETLGGSVSVKNQTVLKLASVSADAEVGTVDLQAESIVGADAGRKVSLAGSSVSLAAAQDLSMTLEGSATLGAVSAKNAHFTVTDEGASLTIANGSMENFSAEVAKDLSVKNDRDLGLGAVSAGGDATFDVAGSLRQNGRTLEADRLNVAGDVTVKATGDAVLDNPYNVFGSTILAETSGKAVFAAANGLDFSSLKATEAELYGGTGDITVGAGSVDSLLAEADGDLAFANDKSLTLRAVDAGELDVSANGDILGTEAVVTRDADAENRLAASGRIALTGDGNRLGPALTVEAAEAKLVNGETLALDSRVSGSVDYLNRNGDLTVTGDTIAGGRIETQGGDLDIRATAIASKDAPLEIASDGAIEVKTAGDAALHRTDGGWTLGPGGHLDVGGNLNLNVEGTLATSGDGILAAGGDISVKAKDYAPAVALRLGGQTLEVDRQSYGANPQWAQFHTYGGNEHPTLVPHQGVWVVLNGALTPTMPSYAYLTVMDQLHLLSTPVLNPTALALGDHYQLADATLGPVDLVGLGRHPYLNLDKEEITYTTKE